MTDTEKDALERRIDELCAEVEALKRDEWSAGFNAGCEAVEAAYEGGKAHYEVENAKLRELVNGLTWCCENYRCDNRCQLYDKSEPDHCCEQRLKRELGIEVPS